MRVWYDVVAFIRTRVALNEWIPYGRSIGTSFARAALCVPLRRGSRPVKCAFDTLPWNFPAVAAMLVGAAQVQAARRRQKLLGYLPVSQDAGRVLLHL